MRGAKSVLLALPIVTIGVIAFAIFVVGAPRPYFGARVYGGPTEGASVLSFRVAVVERISDLEVAAPPGPVAVEVELADGRRASTVAEADERGMAAVRIEIPGRPVIGPLRVRVTRPLAHGGSLVLADSVARLSVADWASRAREHGGWLRGAKKGALSVSVALGRGALAVPFVDPVWVLVRDAKGGVANVSLKLDADGVKIVHPGPQPRTDARGWARVLIAPQEHVAALTVEASGESGEHGHWYGTLPVVAGALRASLADQKLRIESPIERDVAYWAVIGPEGRHAGGIVALDATGRGGAVALVQLPDLPRGPLWAVVSGEPELDSGSTVGWPLRPPAFSDPGLTAPMPARAVADRLLVDGLSIGYRADVERRGRARSIALGFTLLAALLAAVLLFREGRRAASQLDRHLRSAGADPDVADAIGERKGRWIGVLIALLCVAMGFAVVALVALYRIG